mgnify:CR=1 FL=1
MIVVTNPVLEVTTTIGCPVACVYCPQKALRNTYAHRSGASKSMSLVDFEVYLSSVPTSVDVHFSGYSEPWSNADCTEMIRHSVGKGHRTAIFTTLALTTIADLMQLNEWQLKRFVVHLPDMDGLMPIKNIKKYTEKLAALASLSRIPAEFMAIGRVHPECAAIVESIREDRTCLTRVDNLSPEQLDRARQSHVVSRSNLVRHHGPIACMKNRTYQNVLLPDGTVTLCCMDYSMSEVIGNLRSVSYTSLHDNAQFRSVRDAMLSNDGDVICRKCEWALPA